MLSVEYKPAIKYERSLAHSGEEVETRVERKWRNRCKDRTTIVSMDRQLHGDTVPSACYFEDIYPEKRNESRNPTFERTMNSAIQLRSSTHESKHS